MWLDRYVESVCSNDGGGLAANKKDMLYSLFAASSPTFTSSMPHDFLPLMPILAEMAFHRSACKNKTKDSRGRRQVNFTGKKKLHNKNVFDFLCPNLLAMVLLTVRQKVTVMLYNMMCNDSKSNEDLVDMLCSKIDIDKELDMVMYQKLHAIITDHLVKDISKNEFAWFNELCSVLKSHKSMLDDNKLCDNDRSNYVFFFCDVAEELKKQRDKAKKKQSKETAKKFEADGSFLSRESVPDINQVYSDSDSDVGSKEVSDYEEDSFVPDNFIESDGVCDDSCNEDEEA